jgi:hypothetical protein
MATIPNAQPRGSPLVDSEPSERSAWLLKKIAALEEELEPLTRAAEHRLRLRRRSLSPRRPRPVD